jgi:hypothetical protein
MAKKKAEYKIVISESINRVYITKKGTRGSIPLSDALKSPIFKRHLAKQTKKIQDKVQSVLDTRKALSQLTEKTTKTTFLKMIQGKSLEDAELIRGEYERLKDS